MDPLCYLPAELVSEIISNLDFDEQWTGFRNVSRKYNNFVKENQLPAVRNACSDHDLWEWEVVLKHSPTYDSLFALDRDQDIFGAMWKLHATLGTYRTQGHQRLVKDSYAKSEGFVRLLGAGILVTRRLAQALDQEAKEIVIGSLPAEFCALFDLFRQMLEDMLWNFGRLHMFPITSEFAALGHRIGGEKVKFVAYVASVHGLATLEGLIEIPETLKRLSVVFPAGHDGEDVPKDFQTPNEIRAWAQDFAVKHAKISEVEAEALVDYHFTTLRCYTTLTEDPLLRCMADRVESKWPIADLMSQTVSISGSPLNWTQIILDQSGMLPAAEQGLDELVKLMKDLVK